MHIQEKHTMKHTMSEWVKLLNCVRLFATHGLQPTRILHTWNFLGKSTGVRCHFLLQGVSSRPGDRTWVSRIAGRRFTVWATRESQTYYIYMCVCVCVCVCVYTYTYTCTHKYTCIYIKIISDKDVWINILIYYLWSLLGCNPWGR